MKKWVEVALTNEFIESDRKFVDLGGKLQIAVFRVNGSYYAINAWCTHQRATMAHGCLDGFELTCPLHGARFDIRNGRALSLPAVQAAAVYKLKVENDAIYIKI